MSKTRSSELIASIFFKEYFFGSMLLSFLAMYGLRSRAGFYQRYLA
jgi:hypothetical protein